MAIGDKANHAAAFFDLDLTITDRDSFRHFLKKHYFGKLGNWRFIPQIVLWGLLRKIRLISLQTFKEKALVSLRGKDGSHIAKTGLHFFESHLKGIVRDKALERIAWHKKREHPVFIVTSCPDIYIRHLSEHLQCDGYECTKLAYRENDFTGAFDGKDCFGNEKVRRLKQLGIDVKFDLAKSYAYSDHESDLPLLECVGNPVAVTPTENLKKIAIERSWTIENW